MGYAPSYSRLKDIDDRRTFQHTYRTLFHIFLLALWFIVAEKVEGFGSIGYICPLFQFVFLLMEWRREKCDLQQYLYPTLAQVWMVTIWLGLYFDTSELGAIIGLLLQVSLVIPYIHCCLSKEARWQWHL